MEYIEKFRKACCVPKTRILHVFKDGKGDHYGNFVYALVNGETIIYIGCSSGLRTRITQHSLDKIFDHVIAYRFREYHTAAWREGSAISAMKPPLNKHSLGISRRKELDERYIKTPVRKEGRGRVAKYHFSSLNVGEEQHVECYDREKDVFLRSAQSSARNRIKDERRFSFIKTQTGFIIRRIA